jgi:tetratricopeptide (TPR) repeat protein
MKRIAFIFTLILLAATTSRAQIGKSVAVTAGTPEDKALTEIYAAPDGPEKVALLDKFMADYGKGDLELLGDQLYASTYLAQKNDGKAIEYADKVLVLDPDNLPAAVTVVHAADELGDTAKLFDAGERAAAIVARFKKQPMPAGMSQNSWDDQRNGVLHGAQADLDYVQNALFNAAYKTADPKAKAAYFERFAAAFPDSPYALNAREQVVFADEQAQNVPKMMEAAQGVLASDPNNVDILLLLADFWSEKGQQLEKAAQYAQKALDALAKAKKPDQTPDDQWQQQVSVQQGLAYSTLGQVDVIKGQNSEAVAAFKKAGPLLKSSTVSYARNQYRLGFTLAKMQRIPEAKAALTEAASLDSPYRAMAQQTLAKIGGGPAHTAKQSP